MKSNPTFAALMQEFAYRYDLRTAFDDFLTMTLCAFSHNPVTGKSYDEDLYLETMARYKDDPLRFVFPKLLGALISEMEERIDCDQGNDVLGDFYQEHLYRKGASQYFTPWSLCSMIAKVTVDKPRITTHWPLRILDPTCGSGRMLIASAKECGWQQEYYGIDIDHTCVKMAALNLFLNGIFGSEVMCADALQLEDFKVSYKISFLPFGIFRITDKTQSGLYHMHQALGKQKATVPETSFESPTSGLTGQQLTFF